MAHLAGAVVIPLRIAPEKILVFSESLLPWFGLVWFGGRLP